jgi:hypothetical protein
MNQVTQCEQCKRTVRREDTLIVVDKGDGHREKRLCRDCQYDFYIGEAKGRGMKVGFVGKFGEEQIKEGEERQVKWSKGVRDGR